MDADQALAHVIRLLDERVLQIQEILADDACKTIEEYKKLCGEVKGLFTARNYITDLNKTMENSDE
jgi:hypothetical protein